jgi:hypothetical protein
LARGQRRDDAFFDELLQSGTGLLAGSGVAVFIIDALEEVDSLLRLAEWPGIEVAEVDSSPPPALARELLSQDFLVFQGGGQRTAQVPLIDLSDSDGGMDFARMVSEVVS